MTSRTLDLIGWLSLKLCATAAVAMTFQGFGIAAAAANDGLQPWNPFRTESASFSSAHRDRQFARQWEANPPRGYPTLSRANIAATERAIVRYIQIVERGGWGTVPAVRLYAGTSGHEVKRLHDRLYESGDLAEVSFYPSQFSYELERALKRFQASNGLSPTGTTDRRTIAALNIPADVRLRQLQINLRRLRSDVKADDQRYLVVNIPAAQVEAISDDRVVSRHAGVVGKVDRKTPLLSSRIHEINFNPVWRLPPTVIREDLIPKGRQMQGSGQDVLTEFGIDAYSGGQKVDPKSINWRSSEPFQLSYSQKPGDSNPLGFAKINFHNSHAVYLHDTPSDRIFGSNFRAASSGCVRVENMEDLLVWLLASNDGWGAAEIERIKKSGDTKTVRLKRQVPLHMVYITAWATADDVVQFRRDLYFKDGVGQAAASY